MVIDIAVKEVLEIGANVHPQAKQIPGWENAHVLTLDIDAEQHPDIVADAAQMPDELENRFDGIFASHVLEHFSYWKTDEVLNGWVRCLKEGGELHILVPSWEWAAREVPRPLFSRTRSRDTSINGMFTWQCLPCGN